MKKKMILFSALILFALIAYLAYVRSIKPNNTAIMPVANNAKQTADQDNLSVANPASSYCQENGGEVQIITGDDGSQLVMCQFDDHSCEEWAYFNGECTIEEDAEKIKEALVAKGLNLSGMKVVIHEHMGKYIGGSVVPESAPGGGGYVFAVKEDGQIKVVADGNGAIMCSSLADYPDFPAYLISECIDESGNPVSR